MYKFLNTQIIHKSKKREPGRPHARHARPPAAAPGRLHAHPRAQPRGHLRRHAAGRATRAGASPCRAARPSSLEVAPPCRAAGPPAPGRRRAEPRGWPPAPARAKTIRGDTSLVPFSICRTGRDEVQKRKMERKWMRGRRWVDLVGRREIDTKEGKGSAVGGRRAFSHGWCFHPGLGLSALHDGMAFNKPLP
jgi:hypothetical protein